MSEKLTPLMRAAEKGDMDKARALLEKGASANEASFMHVTPLHVAAKTGHVALIHLLVAHGAKLEAADAYRQQTPLHYACHAGHAEAARALLTHGASPTSQDKENYLPVHHACYSGLTELAQELLAAHPAHLNARAQFGDTPLHEALTYLPKGAPLAVWLVEHGADLSATEVLGETPLFKALSQPDLVALMLTRGADVNARNEAGETPLHACAEHKLYTVSLETLVQAGAEVEAQNDDEQTPLFVAVENNNLPAVRALLAHGADPNRLNGWHPQPISALALALTRNLTDLLALLQNTTTVLPNPPDYWGVTPLHAAARRGDLPLLKRLLAHHPAQLADHAGITPLHGAARHGQLEAMRALLNHGADPNARDASQRTPAHHAAAGQHPAALSLLAEHHADLNLVCRAGFTPATTPPAQPSLATCPACAAPTLAESGMVVLHGNPYTPARDTDIEVRYACATCGERFTAPSYGSSHLSGDQRSYHWHADHHTWMPR